MTGLLLFAVVAFLLIGPDVLVVPVTELASWLIERVTS